MNKIYPLPKYVQCFFTDRLLTQMRASPNTVASYRDTFRLLLNFAKDQAGRSPTELEVAHIDAELIGRFLMFCEEGRGRGLKSNGTKTYAKNKGRIKSSTKTAIGAIRLVATVAQHVTRAVFAPSRHLPDTRGYSSTRR